jgi:hypothetical protein
MFFVGRDCCTAIYAETLIQASAARGWLYAIAATFLPNAAPSSALCGFFIGFFARANRLATDTTALEA